MPQNWHKAIKRTPHPKAQFAELHIHPFRIQRSCLFENKVCQLPFGPTFPNRATFEAIRQSDLSLVVASFVKLDAGGLGLRYMRSRATSYPGKPTRKDLLIKFELQQRMRWEIVLAKWRIEQENAFVRYCGTPATQRTKKQRALFLAWVGRYCARRPADLATPQRRDHWQSKERVQHTQDFSAQTRLFLQRFASLQPQSKPFLQGAKAAYKRLWKTKERTYCTLCEYLRKRAQDCKKPNHTTQKLIEIVDTPQKAKDAIKQGKVAMVLGLEQLAFLHDEQDVAFYRQQGIRLSTLVHLSDNCLSGSADLPWERWAIRTFQTHAYGPGSEKACVSQLADKSQPKRPRDTQCLKHWNKNQGLTQRGVHIVRSMMRHGLIIDLAHLTQGATNEILQCMKPNTQGYPPVLYSHTNFRHSPCGEQGEFGLSKDQLQRIHKLGGMVGFGFHQKAIRHLYSHRSAKSIKPLVGTYPKAAGDHKVLSLLLENIGSMQKHARHLAFGLDYNGGIDPPAPFPSVAYMNQLATFIKQEQPSVFKSLATSAPHFIEIWQKVERARLWWRGKAGPIPFCPKRTFHKSCPWEKQRKLCK